VRNIDWNGEKGISLVLQKNLSSKERVALSFWKFCTIDNFSETVKTRLFS
jgi:hypothetical protein